MDERQGMGLRSPQYLQLVQELLMDVATCSHGILPFGRPASSPSSSSAASFSSSFSSPSLSDMSFIPLSSHCTADPDVVEELESMEPIRRPILLPVLPTSLLSEFSSLSLYSPLPLLLSEADSVGNQVLGLCPRQKLVLCALLLSPSEGGRTDDRGEGEEKEKEKKREDEEKLRLNGSVFVNFLLHTVEGYHASPRPFELILEYMLKAVLPPVETGRDLKDEIEIAKWGRLIEKRGSRREREKRSKPLILHHIWRDQVLWLLKELTAGTASGEAKSWARAKLREWNVRLLLDRAEGALSPVPFSPGPPVPLQDEMEALAAASLNPGGDRRHQDDLEARVTARLLSLLSSIAQSGRDEQERMREQEWWNIKRLMCWYRSESPILFERVCRNLYSEGALSAVDYRDNLLLPTDLQILCFGQLHSSLSLEKERQDADDSHPPVYSELFPDLARAFVDVDPMVEAFTRCSARFLEHLVAEIGSEEWAYGWAGETVGKRKRKLEKASFVISEELNVQALLDGVEESGGLLAPDASIALPLSSLLVDFREYMELSPPRVFSRLLVGYYRCLLLFSRRLRFLSPEGGLQREEEARLLRQSLDLLLSLLWVPPSRNSRAPLKRGGKEKVGSILSLFCLTNVLKEIPWPCCGHLLFPIVKENFFLHFVSYLEELLGLYIEEGELYACLLVQQTIRQLFLALTPDLLSTLAPMADVANRSIGEKQGLTASLYHLLTQSRSGS